MLVRTEVSVVRAIAGRGGRSMRNRFMNSAAMCCASAALPPLPKRRSFRPALNASAIAVAAAAISADIVSAIFSRSSDPSLSERATDSFKGSPPGQSRETIIFSPAGCQGTPREDLFSFAKNPM
jgi:hypothetical protein